MSSTYEDMVVVPTIDTELADDVAGEPTEHVEQVEHVEYVELGVPEPTPAWEPAPAPAEEGPTAAARLLEIAARNADQLLDEARAEADELKASAREEADRLLSEARTEVEGINEEIAGLRETEQTHRDRLREHLQQVLAKVDETSAD